MNSILIAVGGNSLIRAGEKGTGAEQMSNARRTAAAIVGLVRAGYRIVFETTTPMPVELAVPSLSRPPLARPVRAACRLLAAARPTLFGYQFVFEAAPA